MKRLGLFTILTLTVFIFIACSKDSNIKDIKAEKASIRGIVEVVENDTFTINSQDRIKQGKIVVTKRMEIERNRKEVNVGDTITIYHDKIEGNTPARISRVYAIEINEKATPESIENIQLALEGKSEPGNLEIDYYKMPILTVTKGEKIAELNEDESALVHDIINSVEWEDGAISDFKHDYVIMDGVEVVATFNSKEHTLNDEFNDINITLHEGVSSLLKITLDGDL